jgi:hypothetical protein
VRLRKLAGARGPRPGARTARAFAVAFLAAAAVRAEPVLEATASVVATRPRLQVNVVVTNRGDRAASRLGIVGELLGQRQEAQLPGGVVAGGSGAVVLDFDATGARPGVHALVLQLEHPIDGAPDAAGNPPLASRRVGLLLPLAEEAAPGPVAAPGMPLAPAQPLTPPVLLTPKPCVLAVAGRLQVVLASADGAPHHVRLRAFPPRGLRADGDGVEVDVPARGEVSTALPLVRAGAARGTRHDVVLVAETTREPFVRTSLGDAGVSIAPEPSLFPRVRLAILVLGCLLLAVAAGVEIWMRARR